MANILGYPGQAISTWWNRVPRGRRATMTRPRYNPNNKDKFNKTRLPNRHLPCHRERQQLLYHLHPHLSLLLSVHGVGTLLLRVVFVLIMSIHFPLPHLFPRQPPIILRLTPISTLLLAPTPPPHLMAIQITDWMPFVQIMLHSIFFVVIYVCVCTSLPFILFPHLYHCFSYLRDADHNYACRENKYMDK